MTRRPVCLSTLLVALATTASAQLIEIRTVPVAQAEQFAIFPSNNRGMGGVSIAVADTLLDPFSNPAKGGRLGAPYFVGSPTVYSVSKGAGSGRTLPLTGFMKSGSWFGGLSLALQEVDASQRNVFFPPPGPLVALDVINQAPPEPEKRSHGNTFAFATLGRALQQAGLSLAGSVLWAELHAVDGVDLLYAGSTRINQLGHAFDARVGLLKEWPGDRSLEAVLVHNRFGMTHDVTYLDPIWDPGTQRTVFRPRLEQNLDKTNTWGLHLEYERPLADSGWRIGWLATVNRMDHPKIPNYEIMSIPRDPGHSNAFNLGIGISRRNGPATFGIDAVYEPIWSRTWADAAAPVATRLGDTIPVGGKTIENRFRFSNAQFRIGVSRDLDKTAALQLGLIVRSVHYWLSQFDRVQVFGRNQEESWTEWTPTWGVSLRFPEVEIRYLGRQTNGTGRPGVAQSRFVGVAEPASLRAGGIIVAPSGPLTLDEVSVVTHQISISLPLR